MMTFLYPILVAGRSWVLRGVILGFSEEARTRGFTVPDFSRVCLYRSLTTSYGETREARQFVKVRKLESV